MKNKRDSPGFQAGLAGITTSELVYHDTLNAFESMIANRDIVESHIPIWRDNDSSGFVEAVVELYSDVTPFLNTIAITRTKLIQRITSSLLVLFLVLFLIIWQANKILLQQYSDIELANAELAKRSEELEHLNVQLKNSPYALSKHD